MFYDVWLVVRDPTPQGFRLGGDRDARWTTRRRYTRWLCHEVVEKAGRASGARTPTQIKILAYSRDHDFWPFYSLSNVVGATMTWMQKHTSRGYGGRSRYPLSLKIVSAGEKPKVGTQSRLVKGRGRRRSSCKSVVPCKALFQ